MLTGAWRPVIARRIATPVGQRGFDGATGDLGQQRAAAIERGHRNRRIDGAFVATARLAGQMQATLRARHRGRVPDRGLEQHIGGAVANLGGARAHHTADRRRGDVVDDEHVGRIEAALDVVEGDDRLPRFGEPNPEAAGDQAAIVCVHRMPELEHHVVGHVDGR